MPPPPPPSKSYLLQLSDSDLSTDDEAEANLQQRQQQLQRAMFQATAQRDSHSFSKTAERIQNDSNNTKATTIRKDTPETVATTTLEDDEEEEDDDSNNGIQDDEETPSEELALDVTLATPTVRKTKRNRKKKKNKKRKKQNNNNNTSCGPPGDVGVVAATKNATPTQQQPQRRIQFGNVSVRSFERELGTSVVPLDGGWPLGLGNEATASTESNEGATAQEVSVEEYEAAKQERLLQRWKKHQDPHQENETPAAPDVLETRQWDYKHRSKNPLFGLVTEKQRMALLLGEQDLDEVLNEKYAKEHEKNKQAQNPPSPKTGKKNQSASPGKKNKKGNQHNHNGKSRSNSWNGRTRSGSGNYSQSGLQNPERYNEQFTEYDVHHIRNELETIRNQRTQEEARGCTCRRLDVYIPPPGAGKKAAHRRLNVQKIKEELRKRHALPAEHKTRDELELLLHDMVAQEPCCRDDNNCPCVKNGIECQSDACQCWHASHQSKTTHKKAHSAESDEITPTVIRGRCGNKYGMSTVDVPHITQYREPFLTCQPVGSNNSVVGAADAQ